VHSLLVDLKPSPFSDTLYADPPENTDNLRDKAARYMSIEENVEARKRKSHQQAVMGSSRFTRRSWPGRFEHYTPLNASWEAILREACNFELVQLPHSK